MICVAEFQFFLKCGSTRNKKTKIGLFLAENLQNPVDAPRSGP